MRRMLLIVVLISLSGCAKVKPNVGMNMILPPNAEMVVVPKDKTFLMAASTNDAMPEYPKGLVSKNAPDINVCVEIVVDENGKVGSITQLYEIPQCPLSKQQIDQQFSLAVTEAVSKWQFFAAATCTFPAGVPKNDDCNGAGVIVSPMAIRLAFVFSFQVRDGHPIVKKRRA